MNKLTEQELMKLREDLRVILNENNIDGKSNTPDFLLAEFISCWIMDYIELMRKRDFDPRSMMGSYTGELGEVGNG